MKLSLIPDNETNKNTVQSKAGMILQVREVYFRMNIPQYCLIYE